jgi:hypothetical protein
LENSGKTKKCPINEQSSLKKILGEVAEVTRGMEVDSLITSSPTTLRWLSKIKFEIEKRIPSLIYGESKYWASFKSPKTNRNISYLNPQRSQIRLFTRLDLSCCSSLQPPPSSGGWAEEFPSLFVIKTEDMIEKAIELITKSYEYDRQSSGRSL